MGNERMMNCVVNDSTRKSEPVLVFEKVSYQYPGESFDIVESLAVITA